MLSHKDYKVITDIRLSVKKLNKSLCTDLYVNNILPKNCKSHIGSKCHRFNKIYAKCLNVDHICFINGKKLKI